MKFKMIAIRSRAERERVILAKHEVLLWKMYTVDRLLRNVECIASKELW
jgi:hypothetical protein